MSRRREFRRSLIIKCIIIILFIIFLNTYMWISDSMGVDEHDLNERAFTPTDFPEKKWKKEEEYYLQIVLSLLPPNFAPRHIGKELLSEYEREQAQNNKKKQQQIDNEGYNNNDSPITSEDIERAKHNIISLLPKKNNIHLDWFPLRPISEEHLHFVSEVLMFHIANFIITATHNAAPVILDFGCRIGISFANQLPRSTVLCIYEPNDPASKIPVIIEKPPKNLIRMVVRRGFLTGFAPFFYSCNFVSVSIIFLPIIPPIEPTTNITEEEFWENKENNNLIQLVAEAMHVSGAVFTILPVENCEKLLDMLRRFQPPLGQKDAAKEKLIKGIKFGSEVRCNILAEFVKIQHPSNISTSTRIKFKNKKPLRLFQITILNSTRICSKTWGAPLVKWDRAVLCEYINNRVSYRVLDLKNYSNTLLTTVKEPGKTPHQIMSSARRIHPLQYISSINLDTLLGIGLSMYERLRLFGGMIATPRYSDPLPHNWMVGNDDNINTGGRVFRIDKIDKRFDAAVVEEQNYWGRTSRGYLRLLAHHLCLPLAREGVPLALYSLNVTSRYNCRDCLLNCQYLPKGSIPCKACVLCGEAVTQYVMENTTIEGHPRNTVISLHPSGPCMRMYRNYHTARAMWEGWRHDDNKNPIRL